MHECARARLDCSLCLVCRFFGKVAKLSTLCASTSDKSALLCALFWISKNNDKLLKAR